MTHLYRKAQGAYIENGTNSPLFERMGSEDELQQYRQIIDALQNRVRDLERINLDLEYRLEDSAKQCMAVEKECVAIDLKWKEKHKELEKDIDIWKRTCTDQEQKTSKLREHLSRTEKELYGILQRKYEFMRGPGPNRSASGGRGGRGGNGSGRGGAGLQAQAIRGRGEGTHDISDFSPTLSGPRFGGGSTDPAKEKASGAFPDDPFSIREGSAPQEIRQRTIVRSLVDFLGI